MYDLVFSSLALKGVAKLRKSEPASYKKLVKILEELKKHPTTGTGHPEPLKGMSVPAWSRRLSARHRIVYEIQEKKVTVYILSSYGHYDDR